MTTRHGLGRGLKALLTDESSASESGGRSGVLRLPLDQLVRSPLQPRQTFSDESMEDLIRSVRERGVVQPILVRRQGDRYEIVAGERRYRAAREVKAADIPAIIVEASDREGLELALIENLQREGLNAIEEAEGYRTLAERFGLTQDEIADKVGKARPSVANVLRLLDLPEDVRDLVRRDQLSAGHAKVLLGLAAAEEQSLLARQVVRESLSVRELENLVEKAQRAPRKRRASREDIPPAHLAHLTDRLRKRLGTSVRITSCRTFANGKKAKGYVEVEFYSADDLTRILELLGISET